MTSFFVEEGASALIHFQRLGLPAPSPAASRDLPRIRDAQIKVFSREILARFVERMAERLGATPTAIRAGIARAEHHGITTTEDVERYLVILAALGPTFDERVPWARAILARAELDSRQKLNRLERRLRQRRL